VPGSYTLPTIPFHRLRCTLLARERAFLPAYKGSLLRGAFGHALRRAVCAMGPGQPCEFCRLRRACVYTRLFETFVESEPPPFLAGLPTSPRPYVFEPASETRHFEPGDPLDFDLLLFGQATELEAYALLAVERMAAGGLGRDRFPFVLDHVSMANGGTGWRDVLAGGRALPVLPVAPSRPAIDGFNGLRPGRAVLRFLTPTRLKRGDELQPSVGFRALTFAMLRRTLEMAHFHLPGAAAAIDWNFRPLLEQASTVHITASRLAWRDWERYSNRQGRKMTLGGFVGEMEIEGDLESLAPLLRTAEILHVGKGATFGLGRMEIG
jgi:hypothetical protein